MQVLARGPCAGPCASLSSRIRLVRCRHPAAEDPRASKPSQREADNLNPEPNQFKRDRHVILPFDALREMLERVAGAGRSRARYLRQRERGLTYAELLPGGYLSPVL